jgi:hypothetical protein
MADGVSDSRAVTRPDQGIAGSKMTTIALEKRFPASTALPEAAV